jgi:hypothetical protein
MNYLILETPPKEAAEANLSALGDNPYPGDGIAMGLNQSGDTALQLYWHMDKEEEARSQVVVHVPERDLVRIREWKPPLAPGYRPLYTPVEGANMRAVEGSWLIAATEGDLMDGIMDGYDRRQPFAQAFKQSVGGSGEPLHTPKIAGIIIPYGRPDIEGFAEYEFAIAKRGSVVRRYAAGVFGETDSGIGRCAHTFIGDGSPPPAFDKYPFAVPLGEGVKDTAEMFWANLNRDNRVGIAARGIHLVTKRTEYHIINAYDEQPLAQGVE